MIIDRLSSDRLPSRITTKDIERINTGRSLIKKEVREKVYNQKGATIWITGLHASGKNELAYVLEKRLFEAGAKTVLLDGSSVRSGLSNELDFSSADRAEHLRRVAEICRLLNDQGILTIGCFISPREDIRKQVKQIVGEDRFHLIYMNTDPEVCKKRDSQGLYEKALARELDNVPGVDIEYETPQNPDFVFEPDKTEENVDTVLNFLLAKNIFPLQ
jgi:adenylyl-sulfate kinase